MNEVKGYFTVGAIDGNLNNLTTPTDSEFIDGIYNKLNSIYNTLPNIDFGYYPHGYMQGILNSNKLQKIELERMLLSINGLEYPEKNAKLLLTDVEGGVGLFEEDENNSGIGETIPEESKPPFMGNGETGTPYKYGSMLILIIIILLIIGGVDLFFIPDILKN